MKKPSFLIVSLFFSILLVAQTAPLASPIKLAQLPKGIRYRGKMTEAWRWKDNNGENILLLSILGPQAVADSQADEDGMTTELFAVHYCQKDTGYKVVWRLNDHVRDCPLDIVA